MQYLILAWGQSCSDHAAACSHCKTGTRARRAFHISLKSKHCKQSLSSQPAGQGIPSLTSRKISAAVLENCQVTWRRLFLPSAMYMSVQSWGSRFAANWAFASFSASCRTCLGSVSQKPTPACKQSESHVRLQLAQSSFFSSSVYLACIGWTPVPNMPFPSSL